MSDARQICQKLLPTRTQLCKPVWKQRNITYKVNALTFWILMVAHFEVLLNWSKGARNLHRDLCKSVAHMDESLQMVCLMMALHVLHVLHILHWKPQIATSFMIRWWSSKGLRSYTWLRLKWRWICRTLIAAHIIVDLAWKDYNVNEAPAADVVVSIDRACSKFDSSKLQPQIMTRWWPWWCPDHSRSCMKDKMLMKLRPLMLLCQ